MKTTKIRLFGGGAMLFAPALGSMMARGPLIARAPDDGGGAGGAGDDDDPPPGETVDKKVHDTIVAAHEALKRDSRRQRTELTEARARNTELEAELETLRANADGSTDKATAVQQAVATERARYDKDVGARDKTIGDLKKELDDGAAERDLDRALDDHRIKPELRKAAKALLRSQIEVETDDAGRHVYLNNLPVADAVKAWAEGEEGKAFVLDGNTGGAAPGGKSKHTGNNPWKTETLNLTEQDRIQAKDPALAGRLKAEAGVA